MMEAEWIGCAAIVALFAIAVAVYVLFFWKRKF